MAASGRLHDPRLRGDHHEAAILASVELGLYSLWAGILVAFTVHLVIHLGSFVVLRRYVPHIITSVLAMAYVIDFMTHIEYNRLFGYD